MKSWAKDIFLAGLLILVAVPAFAHHGNAAIDNTKQITVTGTITDWVWANPHSWLKMDVKNEKGEIDHWVFEENAPATLVGYGWTRHMFKPGDVATVTARVAKNGALVGRPSKIVVNGKTYGGFN